MAKVVCESCNTSFLFSVVKDLQNCPVCGKPLIDFGDNNTVEDSKETTKWYYYKEGGGTLMTTLSNSFTPLYTFEATDMKDAERQLKEVLPNSPLVNDNSLEKVRCPRCRSTEIQLVPRKYSLLTGFATNKYDRMCVRCQKRF